MERELSLELVFEISVGLEKKNVVRKASRIRKQCEQRYKDGKMWGM